LSLLVRLDDSLLERLYVAVKQVRTDAFRG
jgi:hypothetical protein